jgi:dipeptidyl-peptidase 4
VKRVFGVLLAVVGLLFSRGPAQTAPAPSQGAEKKPLTIEAIFSNGGLTGPQPETVKWSPDGTKLSFVLRDDYGEHGELWYVDATTGEKKVLVGAPKLAILSPPLTKIQSERERERIARYHVAAYVWAPDSKHLLFDAQGQLWLYALENGTAVQFTSASEPSEDPKFSPDGGHIAYVRKHNLYVRPLDENKEEKQLTKDKNENLLNGEVDWVYAEELGVRSNYFWSPDNREIVFLQMDETRVPTYPIVDWLPTHPKLDQEKYPKAGDPNPAVRLGVVSADGGKLKWISLTSDTDTYIPRFGWVRQDVVWAEVLNRAQDKMDLYFVDAHSGKSRKVLTESSPDAWVNVNDDFRVLKSGDRFLWSSWRDGHTHLYLYSFNKQNPLAGDAKLERQLEQGNYEMLELEGVSEDSGVIFFKANQDDPRQTHIFSVKVDGTGFTRLSRGEGTYSAVFADDGKHYAEDSSNALTPPRMSVCTVGGPCETAWESRSVAEYDLTAPKYLEFKAEDGEVLYGQILLPPEGSVNHKVPLILSVYGGPAGQLVKNAWGDGTELFHQLLSRQGFAIFSVDNRGTPDRGRKFSAAIRGQFGAIELKDQLTCLNSLLTQFPQLDRDRVAVWGWSNGGSMTLYSMTHSEMFKAGVSVAPVTDWHNYDSIYTERYMGLPKDNVKGYLDSSMPRAAKDLHGSLLLVHGTNDDNVHLQNSIQMADGLIKAGKQFQLMLYPDKTHSISGPASRTHLFHTMQGHWERELK